jgi:hypothetical protein
MGETCEKSELRGVNEALPLEEKLMHIYEVRPASIIAASI